MKYLWTITWALALVLLLAQAGAAQDSSGVVGWEVFSTSTPGGGGTMESQGLNGERTAWFITHVAPGNAGVVNMVVTYYDSKESRDKAKEKEKEKEKNKKGKKADEKKPDGPAVPTYDPRFYEYKDGKLVPKTQHTSNPNVNAAMNTGTITANGGNGGGHSDTTYDKLGNASTPTYDPRFFEYSDGKLVRKDQRSSSNGQTDSNRQTASVEGLVVPDNVYDRQPFSFAAPQIAGEVVTIQTIEGEVVQTTSSDRYGRIFLAAGLPMG